MTQQTNPKNTSNNKMPVFQALFSRIKVSLSAPVFEDPEKTRKAYLTNALMLATIGLLGAYMLISPLASSENLGERLLVFVLIETVSIIAYIIMRQGYVTEGAITFLLILWAIIAVSTFFFDGVIGPSFATLILIIYGAGLIISNRASLIYALMSIALGLTLIFLSNLQILPEPITSTTPLSIFGSLAFIFAAVTLFTYFANQNLNAALKSSEENQAKLELRNQEFSEIRRFLEETVADRTAELERRNKYLEANTIIAQDAISTLDPQLLLDRTASLISEQFDYYHVGIFLVDDDNQWAVLRSASSPGGKQMIARTHRLSVGKQGIVGYVTGIGQPRISQDIGLDRIHTTTPELPETRSEMAVPLKARGQIIGAIDIQSTEENAFNDDDVQILQTLADQVALALDNARLYQRSQQSAEDAQKLYGEYSQQAWREAYQMAEHSAYRFSSDASSEPTHIDVKDHISKSLPGLLEMPIVIRGQTAGSIDIVKDGSEEWTDDEIRLLQTLSDQLGVALDSARLFTETQIRAATEQLIGKVSTEIRETLDIDTVLKSAVEKVRQVMELPEVTIRLAAPSSSTTNGQISE